MPHSASLKLGLVDDHKLFRKGLVSLIEMINKDYTIVFEADNGLDLQDKITKENEPDIILMDVSMPKMDGFECVQWLSAHHPNAKVLIISMIEKEETIVRMLKMGVKGYLCKDVEPQELGAALHAIANKGFYYTDYVTGKLLHSLQIDDDQKSRVDGSKLMNDREREFLQLACSEMTYREIADRMFLSPKTIDGYRNSLFEKLNAKSRVGLVMFAIRNGIVRLD